MNNKNWPFWATGTFWTLILLGILLNGFLRLSGRPFIDLWGFESSVIFIAAIAGFLVSALKFKQGLILMGVFLIGFGIVGALSAFVAASSLESLLIFLKVSGFCILAGLVNFLAKKAE